MKVAIINFPGTNCERDTRFAFDKLGCKTDIIWHTQSSLKADLVVLPGGFSYGDYLRTAAIAKFSPIMLEVIKHIKSGGYALGICNGFQMLLESGLLAGAMRRNENMRFISKFHHLKVISTSNKFLSNFKVGDIINIPISHGEGNYYIDQDGLKELEDNDQILLKYCLENGELANPNGSINSIAGICNKTKNVFGLMPHPERACQEILGGIAGLEMLKGLVC